MEANSTMEADSFVAAPLPPSCPPSEARPFEEGEIVLRLVAHNPPIAEDFLPNSKIPNKRCPAMGDKCRWAGISVWDKNVKREVLEGITKLPKNSHLKFLARVRVRQTTGVDQRHLTCWAYKSYDFTSEIEKLEQLNDVQ
jgi:hypothetical protein